MRQEGARGDGAGVAAFCFIKDRGVSPPEGYTEAETGRKDRRATWLSEDRLSRPGAGRLQGPRGGGTSVVFEKQEETRVPSLGTERGDLGEGREVEGTAGQGNQGRRTIGRTSGSTLSEVESRGTDLEQKSDMTQQRLWKDCPAAEPRTHAKDARAEAGGPGRLSQGPLGSDWSLPK